MLIPRHVAIIMDGNNRWAKRRAMPAIYGHQAGVKALRKTVKAAIEYGIEYLTLYAFSVDNWKRSPKEVKAILNLMRKFLSEERESLIKQEIRLMVIGQKKRVPEDILKQIDEVTELTKKNTKLNLVIAFNYGSRTEIIDGVKKIVSDVLSDKISSSDINEKTFSKYLYTRGIPDPDLLIRTSGEMRISDFLLWQIAYSELWMPSIYWPEFNKKYLKQAIMEFNKRQRRYGGRTNVDKKNN